MRRSLPHPLDSKQSGADSCVHCNASAALEPGLTTSAYAPLLPDTLHRHSVSVAARGCEQTLNRLVVGLAAELKGLVVHGQDMLRIAVGGHAPSLFGIAVHAN